MKNPMPAARPKCGPMRPLVCHGNDLDLDRRVCEAQDFETLLHRWRVEHLERDWSFRVRVLRAAGLMD